MSKCPTQRDDGSGGVYMTLLLPKYRTVTVLAPSQDSMRRTPPVRVKMEWDTSGVRAHRPRCPHPILNGLAQAIQRVPKIDTEPVGGPPVRPRHQQVTTRTWWDGSPPLLERPKYMRLRSHTALDRPRMVARVNGYSGPDGPREIRSDGELTSVRTSAVYLVKRDEQKVMA